LKRKRQKRKKLDSDGKGTNEGGDEERFLCSATCENLSLKDEPKLIHEGLECEKRKLESDKDGAG